MGKKSTQTSTTTYGNTTTKNPYAVATTNNSGTTTNFAKGSALETIYNFTNKNIGTLLDDYLNPNLNSTTNQAKLNAFRDTMNTETKKSLENNIINPLSQRNMVRSSQATDLYKNLSNTTTTELSNYINSLLSEAQDNSASMISNLLSAYMNGYNVLSNMQGQSLNTSMGNATKTTTTKSSFDIVDAIGKTAGLISSFSGLNLPIKGKNKDE